MPFCSSAGFATAVCLAAIVCDWRRIENIRHRKTGAIIDSFVIISGCSGGGKSTLLDELARRGYPTTEEPGRRIVREQLHCKGTALPWIDEAAFIRLVIAQAQSDHIAARQLQGGWVFFDRSLLDALIALKHLTGVPTITSLEQLQYYHRRVFMAPPWPEIYVTDDERRHGLNEGIAEYRRLVSAYPSLGYEIMTLPLVAPSERAEFILQTLAG